MTQLALAIFCILNRMFTHALRESEQTMRTISLQCDCLKLNGSTTTTWTWVDFDSVPEDRLVAAANFSSDQITTLNRYVGISQVEGIQAGFETGDLWFSANHFDGDVDQGEFQVLGTKVPN